MTVTLSAMSFAVAKERGSRPVTTIVLTDTAMKLPSLSAVWPVEYESVGVSVAHPIHGGSCPGSRLDKADTCLSCVSHW